MSRNRSTSADGKVSSDQGDPNQRTQDAQHDGSDGTIPVAGPSFTDRTGDNAQELIDSANEGAKVEEVSGEPRSEADFGGAGEKRTLRTKGEYMIQDPTTGVEITNEAREVDFSAFLQGQIDLGLVEEA